MKILIGTSNQGKIDQYLRIFKKHMPEAEPVTLSELKITQDVDEDADNLPDNAKKKAEFYGEKSGMLAIADDVGLYIDALGGEPGIHAKRWHNGTENDRCVKILERMENIPEEKRTCSYRGAVAVYNPQEKTYFTSETSEPGKIASKVVEAGGFGYDSIFIATNFNKYYSELSDDERDSISHRTVGIRKFSKRLKNET
jgi:non-canonical purine NTP pyrophosphatase (RdgB/HAM1 family)